MKEILKLDHIQKYYGNGGNVTKAIQDISFSVQEGEFVRNVAKRYRETASEASKQQYEEFMRITPCASCKGQRLKPTSLAVTVADKNIYEITNMPILDLQDFLQNMKIGRAHV